MKRKTLSRVCFTTLVMLNFIFCQQMKASHTMGADLTYQCMGGNTYKVTLSFYRDCIGIPAPTNPIVKISSTSCGSNLGITCYPRAGTGQEVTPACSSSVTTCNGGTFTGIQEWVYDGIVTLPMQCTDWVFSYNLCCRNAAITNISSPGSNTFYIYATLNNTIGCNSSPNFSNKPVPFLCVGQQYCFNHGANDSDGDSISYSLITPKQSANTNVNYFSPYSATNPLNSIPTTSFNAATGDICLTPQSLQVSVMAVLVKEFRNGVLIGSVERDLQLTVMNCNNNLPTLSGINGTNNFSMTICAGQQTCFTVFSNDVDTGQRLNVTWNNGIANASFVPNSALHPSSAFCWTPSAADISNTPHVFTVRVADNACPYIGSQIYSFSITVKGMLVDAGIDQNIACSDNATLTAHASGGSGTYSYLWNNGSTMQSITVGSGVYIVSSGDGQCSATDTVEVVMAFHPTASFGFSPPSCVNSSIQFSDSSTTPGGSFVSWYWDLGDGAISNLQNPTHQYSLPGTYQVILAVENSLGCMDTIVQQIQIHPSPVPSIIFTNNCFGQDASFSGQSTQGGNLNSWIWDFGDSTFSNGQLVTHHYNSPGSYFVTLIVKDTFACSGSLTKAITIHSLPLAYAGIDQRICSGQSATLIGTGGGTYSWLPTGSTSSTIIANPITTTKYILTVTDSNGCIDNDTITVIINPIPLANVGPDITVCSGSSLTLTATGGSNYSWNPGGYNSQTITIFPTHTQSFIVTVSDAIGCSAKTSVKVIVKPLPTAILNPLVNVCSSSSTTLTASGGVSYNWIPTGSTSSSIIISPMSGATYMVVVKDANGCVDSADAQVIVHQAPVINLQSIFLCSGSSAIVNAGNPGSNYFWTPTGDTTQTVTIASGGTYSITVTDSFGCAASDSCQVTIGPSLSVNMGNVSFCQGDSALFDAGNPGMSYLWTPNGETTQTIMVHQAGTYGVVITDSIGCSGSITSTAQINPLPVPDFSYTQVCHGTIASFTDHTISSGSFISSWNWNFGDGTSSNLQNPLHLFPSSGSYSVSLQTTSSNGCFTSVTKNVVVNPLPVADFVFANGCAGSSVSFTNNSSVTSTSIASYFWNFGDSITSLLENPSHQYTTSHDYNITLQVVTTAGCSSSKTQTITISPLPVVAFTATEACLGNPSLITNGSHITTGSLVQYAWNFGDSSTSNQQQPIHTFSSPGTFPVHLLVTSGNGCVAEQIQPVVVYALPKVNAGNDQQACPGNSVTLSASGAVAYNWSPGGFNTQNLVVQITASSVFTVVGIDSHGCSASDDVAVGIHPYPTILSGPDQSICAGESTTVHAGGGMIYFWLPGGTTEPSMSVNPLVSTNYVVTVTDSNHCQSIDTVKVSVNSNPLVSTGPDLTICNNSTISISATGAMNYVWSPGGLQTDMVLVTPTSNASYVVTGTDANGCQSSDTMQITVNESPVVSIPFTLVCPGSFATLDAGNAGSTYAWSTGETTQSISVSDTGNYQVVVTFPNNCPTLASVSLGAGDMPLANFSAQHVCANSPMNLNDQSSIASGSIVSWAWDFGDQSTSAAINPTHLYSGPGQYQVTLTVTSNNNCHTSYRGTVEVMPNPVAEFTALNVCFSNATQFINQTSGTGFTNLNSYWNFSDGTVSQSANPSHVFSAPGNFLVKLQVSTPFGCSNEISHAVRINRLPSASFTANNSCLGTPIDFINQSISGDGEIISQEWDFGDGTKSTSRFPVHTFHAPGSYDVTLTTFNSYGCFNTATRTIEVHPVPQPRILSNDVCLGSPTAFADTSTINNAGDISYYWDLGDSFTAGSSEVTHTYQSAGTYPIVLVASVPNGCHVEKRFHVKVHPIPDVSFHATNVCFPDSTLFRNSSRIASGSVNNFFWNFGDGQNSTLGSPIHGYASSGSYVVTLHATSDKGCVDEDTFQLKISPRPEVNFSGSIQGCSPLNATLADSSRIVQGSIAGWLWNFGDGEYSTLQHPYHVFNQPGVYPVSLTVVSDEGCQSTFTAPDFINVFPKPYADFEATPNAVDIFNPVVQFNNLSQNYVSLSWNFGDGTNIDGIASPTHTFNDTGNYSAQLIVLNSYGCRDTAYRIIDVIPHSTLLAPNCFTPNGDGKNDSFQPVFTDVKNIQVWIYNRWGELLTNWEGLDGSWNGYYKGHPCIEDVYVYQIKGIGTDGKKYNLTGHVSLVY